MSSSTNASATFTSYKVKSAALAPESLLKNPHREPVTVQTAFEDFLANNHINKLSVGTVDSSSSLDAACTHVFEYLSVFDAQYLEPSPDDPANCIESKGAVVMYSAKPMRVSSDTNVYIISHLVLLKDSRKRHLVTLQGAIPHFSSVERHGVQNTSSLPLDLFKTFFSDIFSIQISKLSEEQWLTQLTAPIQLYNVCDVSDTKMGDTKIDPSTKTTAAILFPMGDFSEHHSVPEDYSSSVRPSAPAIAAAISANAPTPGDPSTVGNASTSENDTNSETRSIPKAACFELLTADSTDGPGKKLSLEQLGKIRLV